MARDADDSGSTPPSRTAPPATDLNQIERGPDRTLAQALVLDEGARQRLAALRAADRATVAATTQAAPRYGPLGERFIAALVERLDKSELAELGWKGREDLNPVLEDLRKLAAVNFQRAADLWSKYRPDDRDRPSFLDSDEFSENRQRGSAPTTPVLEEDEKKEFVTPEQLRKRFIQAENRYYFRHDNNKLAFEDHGRKIATEHDDPVVALSMVQLAQAKGWQTLTVKGTEEFKREAWLQASLKKMDVRGFRPRDVDLQKLAELQKELGANPRPLSNEIERIRGRMSKAQVSTPRADKLEPPDRTGVVDEQRRTLSESQRLVLDTIQTVLRKRGDSDRAVAMATSIAAERFQNNRVYVGKVLEHGPAPYENKQGNELSYFVKLETPTGPRDIWGVDVKRAISESGVTVGDEVAIANQGKQQVTVKVKQRDDAGKIVGANSIVTNRNTWDVRNIESLREDARARLSAAATKSDRAPPIKVYDIAADRADPRPDVKVDKSHDHERTR